MGIDKVEEIYKHYCDSGENLLDAFSIHTYLLWDSENSGIECEPDDYCFRYSQLRKLKKAEIVHEEYKRSKKELIRQVRRYYARIDAELSDRRRVASAYVYKKAVREAVFNKMGVSCLACGCSENIAIDHIIPVIKGGKDELENLQPLCVPCNSSKGATDNDVFMKMMKARIKKKQSTESNH